MLIIKSRLNIFIKKKQKKRKKTKKKEQKNRIVSIAWVAFAKDSTKYIDERQPEIHMQEWIDNWIQC